MAEFSVNGVPWEDFVRHLDLQVQPVSLRCPYCGERITLESSLPHLTMEWSGGGTVFSTTPEYRSAPHTCKGA